MMKATRSLPDCVVPNGAAVSNAIKVRGDGEGFQQAAWIIAHGSAALAENASIEVAYDEAGTAFCSLLDPATGTAVAFTGAKALPFLNSGFFAIRIALDGNAAANRTFKMGMVEES